LTHYAPPIASELFHMLRTELLSAESDRKFGKPHSLHGKTPLLAKVQQRRFL